MNNILELLKSPVFWVGTVIVGLLTNVVSHYMIKKWDNFLAHFSKTLATSTQRLKFQREKRITRLINNPTELQFALSLATNTRVRLQYNFAMIILISLIMIMFKLYKISLQLNHEPIPAFIPVIKYILIVLGIGSIFALGARLVRSEFLLYEVLEAKERLDIESKKATAPTMGNRIG